jgi:hypothetical protein
VLTPYDAVDIILHAKNIIGVEWSDLRTFYHFLKRQCPNPESPSTIVLIIFLLFQLSLTWT